MIQRSGLGMHVTALFISILLVLRFFDNASGAILPFRMDTGDVVIYQDANTNTNANTSSPSTTNTTTTPNTSENTTVAVPLNATTPLNPFNSSNSFNITAKTVPKPNNQSAGMSLHEMSIVLSKENLSQNVSDAIVTCLANYTWTSPDWWGLYNTSQFSHTLIQAEYYAYCIATTGLQFRINITNYMKGTQLTDCVRIVYRNFPDDASIVYARKVIESLPNGTHGDGGIPAWIIGVIVGVLILISFVVSIVIMFKKTRIYDPLLFELDEEVESTSETRRLREQQQLDAHVNAIRPGYQ